MFRNILRSTYRYHEVKNMEQYKSLVTSLKTPYVLDFFADWCGPCKMLFPIVSKLEKQAGGKWALIKIDVDNQDLGQIISKHNITGVPTIAFYKGDKKLYQKTGFANQADFKSLEQKYLRFIFHIFNDLEASIRKQSNQSIFEISFNSSPKSNKRLLQIKKEINKIYKQFMQQGDIHHIDFLYNDLYQFTCSFTYFQAEKHEDQATFEVFFRKHPFNGHYAIFAGLQEVKKFIYNFKITPEQQAFLKKTLPDLTPEYFQWLKQDFNKKIKVKAFREGQIVFAREPLISYTGPLSFVQILETPILNLLGFATLVATNASRMAKAVAPKKCVQFGIRRAQGPDGGLSASAYAYLGGFQGTSNMKASQIFEIPCIGTMSHAYITSFTSLKQVKEFSIGQVNIVKRSLQIRKQFGWDKTNEGQLAAFLNYARTFTRNFKTLIDTYNNLQSGLLNTIIVAKALSQAGIKQFGIRLDSGDLCQLSKRCRQIWLQHLPHLKFTIFASDDLHQQRLVEIQKNKSQIDVYAIGTNIATCKKQPALGLVCKLTQINHVPRMKFSADPQKSTLPCDKAIYRVWTDNSEKASFDLIGLEGEQITLGQQNLFTLKKEQSHTAKITKFRRMNEELNISEFIKTIKQNRQQLQKSVEELPQDLFELKSQSAYPIMLTPNFLDRFHKVRHQKHEIN